MSDITLEPYLFFPGHCREAMEFYQGVFGGELTLLKMNPEGPPEPSTSPSDRIMHARLEGGDVVLMGSDGDNASLKAAKVSLSLIGLDEPKLRTIFDKLGADATVVHPLTKESWGDLFGMVNDKYGVQWMVNVTLNKAPA